MASFPFFIKTTFLCLHFPLDDQRCYKKSTRFLEINYSNMDALDILNEFEIRCVINEFENYSFDFKSITPDDSLDQIINFLCDCVCKSDFEAVLQKSLKAYGFSSLPINLENSEHSIHSTVYNKCEENPSNQVQEFILLFIAISALQEFVRCNFCGPRDNVPANYRLISELLPDSDVLRKLSLDGESIYSNVVHPKLLYISQYLLSNFEKSACLTQKWWLLRCTFLHQRVLPERNNSLHSKLVSLTEEVYQMEWIQQEKHISKKLVFAVESCHIFLFYGEIVLARKYIADAQIITGLEIELSGAFGKRTQFQQKPVAQLYVKLKRNHLNFTGTVSEKSEFLPADLQLQDDTLLNKISFVDSDDHIFNNLYAEEQIVLLGYCCLVQRSGSFDELLQEEMMSYINCLLSQPQVWSVFVTALVMRCKIEKTSSRRIERAVTQMEAVVESIKKSLPSFSERQKLFYSASFSAFWMLEKELADLLLSIGCIKSALDVYERLELWEDIVECYVRLGRTSSAEKVINEQLTKGETPMLWCLLGDVSENPEHYLKAWEMSNHRSARAQRSLGYYYYKQKEYGKSIPPFLASVEINHLQPQVWFSIGHAATQTEDFELAARAYRQVVMFDEDQFEAWNNLANAYIKTKQKVRAWRSLNEALKCNFEEWRVWENFLLVSTDIGAFEDTLRSWHRLFDIKSKHNDALLLEILVNAIIKDLPDINGLPSSRLRKKTLELLGRVTSVITNEPKIWELYSALTHSITEDISEKDKLQKSVLYQQNALRCYNQKGQWERDFNGCKEVLLCVLKLATLSLPYVSQLEGVFQNQQKTSAKLSVQTVITRGKKNLEDFSDSEKQELNDLLESVQNILNEILSL